MPDHASLHAEARPDEAVVHADEDEAEDDDDGDDDEDGDQVNGLPPGTLRLFLF